MNPSDSTLFPRLSTAPRELWSADLDAAAAGEMPWLWHGLLAPGNLTLLTSQWKSGKTPLLSGLLAGRDEGNAAGMLEGLMPLQRLSGQGVAVLVLHHPRKGEPAPGQAARGSGALSGYVDILVEMSWLSRADAEDRRRLLRAWSRHAQ